MDGRVTFGQGNRVRRMNVDDIYIYIHTYVSNEGYRYARHQAEWRNTRACVCRYRGETIERGEVRSWVTLG